MSRGSSLQVLGPALGLLFFWPAPGRTASNPPEASAVAADPQELARIKNEKDRLEQNPEAAQALAERLARSSFAEKIADGSAGAASASQARAWISQHPDFAAFLSVGLAREDAEGSARFEDMMSQAVVEHTVTIDQNGGIFGRVKKTNLQSGLIQKKGADLKDEEESRILSAMYEGGGGGSSRVLSGEDSQGEVGGRGAPGSSALSLSGDFYDRFAKGNLAGYSPDLLALQSSLNARRAPGAPKLAETGRLDYATLSYPAYSLRYDLDRLKQNLKTERVAGRSRPGRTSGASPAPGSETVAGLNDFTRRQEALEKAQRALSDFEAAAALALDPRKISPALLASLSRKQKEAARWVTEAFLEQELQAVRSGSRFLDEPLRREIARAPVEDSARAAYLERGLGLQEALESLRARDESASRLLRDDRWLAHLTETQDALDQAALLRRGLGASVDDYAQTPYRLDALSEPEPRWRAWLENLIVDWLPSSSYAQAVLQKRRETARLKEAFLRIAAGDFPAAREILSSIQPAH